MTPSTSSILTHWTWEPSVVIGILLLTCAYFYVGGPVRQRKELGPPLTPKQVSLFLCAQLVLVISLLSPIDYLGDEYLFSAHMIQHLLLASLWPLLVLLALPGWMAAPILRLPVLGSVIALCTAPVVAMLIFDTDIYTWHVPALYDLTLSNEGVHILEHLTFMAAGLLVWWPILSPIRSQRLDYPWQVLYLFVAAMLMMGLGILFTFSPVVFYSPYQAAPRLWGISAGTDQQLGGLIMWYPGNLPYGIWLIVAFYRWFEGESVEQPRHESRSRVARPHQP